MHALVIRKPGKNIALDELSTRPPERTDRDHVEREIVELERELGLLQELMWGARQHSLLVVLQGRDAAGKDGTIKRVAGALNPRGVHVASFVAPTAEELAHDFLWRIHPHMPRKGEVSILNRSHYEDVLAVRVHGLVKESLWRPRFGHIADFESLLAEHGCIVLKFFLNVSKREQRERLVEREKDPIKAWKLDPTDWKERHYWNKYTKAYEEVFQRCASEQAPWYIVPSDSKWYRNFAVAEAIVAALKPYKDDWRKVLVEKESAGKQALKALKTSQDR
jgi:PPK2 family polyphosphate:nucleotide phosphotransferase